MPDCLLISIISPFLFTPINKYFWFNNFFAPDRIWLVKILIKNAYLIKDHRNKNKEWVWNMVTKNVSVNFNNTFL